MNVRPRPRRGRNPVFRPALAVLGLLLVLLLGISIGRALEDGPSPGGTRTRVCPLEPPALPPAARKRAMTAAMAPPNG